MPENKMEVREEMRGEDERRVESFPGSPKANKEYLKDIGTALHNFDADKLVLHRRNIK